MSVLPSTDQRRKRLRLVFLLVFGVGSTAMLLVFANRGDISWYKRPTQIAQGEAPKSRAFRVGGIVLKESLKRPNNDATVTFEVTDCNHKVKVRYSGVLPDMFSEGQVAVAKGRLNSAGVFEATKVLAKHDPKYIPTAVKRSLANKKICKAVLVKSTRPISSKYSN